MVYEGSDERRNWSGKYFRVGSRRPYIDLIKKKKNRNVDCVNKKKKKWGQSKKKRRKFSKETKIILGENPTITKLFFFFG